MTRTAAALLAIAAVASALRFHRLDRESLWTDEVLSIELARRPLSALPEASRQDGHPPLFVAGLHGWMKVFGESESAVRSFPAVLGTLTVAALFLAARRLLSSAAAMTATVLFAVCPYHVYYSQEARNYTLLVLLTVVSYAFLTEATLDRRTSDVVGYVSSTTLMLYTHVYGFFVWAAQAAWVAATLRPLSTRERIRRLAPLLAVAVLALGWLGAPWTAMLLRQSAVQTTGLHLARPTVRQLLMSWYQFAASPLAALVLMPAAALEVYRGLAGPRPAEEAPRPLSPRSRTALLVLWASVPQLVPFAIAQVAAPIYITRATIVTLPALYLLAAGFLARLATRARLVLIAIVVASSLAAQALYFRFPSKEQWREVAAAVDERARPGDAAVFDAGYGQRGFDHYARSPFLRKVALGHDLASPEGGRELAALSLDAKRVWIVRFQRPPGRALVEAALGPRYRLIGFAPYVGVELYLFEAASSPS